MHLPIRPISGRWPAFVQRSARRFFWADPDVIRDDDASAEEFRTAMSAVHIGGTMKITGGNRHPVADEILLRHLDAADAVIVDIGASDGSTSLDLIRKLPDFNRYVIADLYLTVSAARVGRRTYYFDGAGECIMVVGRRAVAWPAESRLVRALYAAGIRRASTQSAQDVLLLNPDVRRLIAEDPRVGYRTHDVFEPWGEPRPSVIKVANLLRRFYFADAELARAVAVILASLDDGALFLIADNTREKGMPPRAGLYRRAGDRFEAVEESTPRPEIADIITAARLATDPASAG